MAESQQRSSSEPDDSPGRNVDERIGYRFEQLAHGSTEVLIEHEGQLYRLRKTRNGKLILNK